MLFTGQPGTAGAPRIVRIATLPAKDGVLLVSRVIRRLIILSVLLPYPRKMVNLAFRG